MIINYELGVGGPIKIAGGTIVESQFDGFIAVEPSPGRTIYINIDRIVTIN